MFQKPKGTEDFYPEEQAAKNLIFSTFRSICKKHGFSEVESPAFENAELLTKKSGEEIKDQLFLLKRKDSEDFGLRFDLTVPLTRMFMQKQKELPKPVKWSYTSRMWRYERPQAGRMREFYQMGVELFGSPNPEADAEIINLAADFLKSIGLKKSDFEIRLNNRKLLEGLLLKITDCGKIEPVIRAIDKRQKLKDEAEFSSILKEAGLALSDISKLKKILGADTPEKIEKLEMNAIANEGLDEIKTIMKLVDSEIVRIDLSTARGLSYYTGTVFEIFDSKGEIRSICGGGRYDNLVELLGGQQCPATGFAIGLSTLSILLSKIGLAKKVLQKPDYYVAVLGEENRGAAMKIVSDLRKKCSVETDLMRRTLSRQISHAELLNAKKLVVIGENELKSGIVKVKDMNTRKEEEIKIKDL